VTLAVLEARLTPSVESPTTTVLLLPGDMTQMRTEGSLEITPGAG
jgi:hypothetical protein